MNEFEATVTAELLIYCQSVGIYMTVEHDVSCGNIFEEE